MDDAAESDEHEAREVPAHDAPETEVHEEVDDVEPAVHDQDRGREIDSGDLRARGQRQEAERTVQFDVDQESVPQHHHRAEEEQEDAGDDRRPRSRIGR